MENLRRVAIASSASGNGKTTLARELAARLQLPFIDMDALAHRAGWVELSADELRAVVEPIVASDEWVIDAIYRTKLGTLLLDRADIVVWLDLPIRVWLPRLLRRSFRRLRTGEELWHGNRESWRTAFVGRDSLVVGALRAHFSRRRRYPDYFRPYRVVRLRTPAQVRAWLESVTPR
jgi:adenylate kinase family enzyme